MVDKIQKLAQSMYARRAADQAPYVLLLNSDISLTPEIRRASAGTEDWRAFWKKMQNISPKERQARLAPAIANLNLQSGYFALAQIAAKGYFRLILTLNLDDGIGKTVQCLPEEQTEFLVHKTYNRNWLTKALGRDNPRFQIIKLHGDLEIKKLPLTAQGDFELPKDLAAALAKHLDENLIIVGDIAPAADIQQCLNPTANELWWINPHRPAPDSFIPRMKQKRAAGEIISGSLAEFNHFFAQLHRALTEAEKGDWAGYIPAAAPRSTDTSLTPMEIDGGAGHSPTAPEWENFLAETSGAASDTTDEQASWDEPFEIAAEGAPPEAAAPVRAGAPPHPRAAALPPPTLLALGGLAVIVVAAIVTLTQCS